MRWAGACGTKGRGKYIRFWWESPKERPLRRPRHRWEDGIRMDVRETGFSWLRIGTDGGFL
jgi:hypothetical protein